MSKKSTRKKKAVQSRRSVARRWRLRFVLGAGALMASLIAVLVLWPDGSGKTPQAYTLAPESALPAIVRRASRRVQETYRFAMANRETLRWIPCFCGCGTKEGHTSIADCHIKDIKPDGSVVFDFMSLH